MKRLFTLAILAIAGSLIVGLGTTAQVTAGESATQETIIVSSWGGSTTRALEATIYRAFTEETGIEVTSAIWDGTLGKIRAMVEAGALTTHVLWGERPHAITGCEENFLQVIDWELMAEYGVTKADFLPGAVHECGVGLASWSTIYAFDGNVFPEGGRRPENWVDFYDMETFPGMRALRKSPKGNLEWALVADGVPMDKVYEFLGTEEGINRAFAKLDTIKDHVIWWEKGAQAPQLMADGEVVMSSAWNARMYNAIVNEGQNFVIVWNGQAMSYDFWIIPNGHSEADVELAHKFIAFAVRARQQGAFSNVAAFGPLRKGADEYIGAAMLPHLPTAPANMDNYIQFNDEFWADHQEELTERFEAWLQQ